MSPRLSTSNISCADDAAKLFRDAPAHAATLLKGGEVDVLRCPGAIIQIQRGPASLFRVFFSSPFLLKVCTHPERQQTRVARLMDARHRGAWSFVCGGASPLGAPPSAHVAPAAAPLFLSPSLDTCLTMTQPPLNPHLLPRYHPPPPPPPPPPLLPTLSVFAPPLRISG